MANVIVDITNMCFGTLIAIAPTEKRISGKVVWHCICNCQQVTCIKNVFARGDKLRSSEITSCRQYQVQDIIGQTFGRWLVLAKTDRKNTNGNYYYHCQCICGVTKDVVRTFLQNGESTSCGCLTKQIDGLANARNRYRQYIHNADMRDIEFDLTFDEWYPLTQANCIYCGKPPSSIYKPNGYKLQWIYNGVDRIDNRYGYSIANCASCCKVCNYAKRELTTQEYIDHCQRVVTFNKVTT